MFTGEYRHSVDDKGRIAVPAKFRLQLDGGAYLARWIDACLAIFPKAEFEALAGKVGGLRIADAAARTFSRAALRRAPTRSSSTARAGSSSRPRCASSLGLAGDAVDRRGPRPRRDLGAGRAGTTTAGRWRHPMPSPPTSPASGSEDRIGHDRAATAPPHALPGSVRDPPTERETR